MCFVHFNLKLQVRLHLNDAAQHGLFADKIEVSNNEQHAERVWSALQKAFIFFIKTIFILPLLSESLVPISIYLITVFMCLLAMFL